MWGMLINGIQAAALEHEGMKTATWSGFNSEYDLIKDQDGQAHELL